MITSIKEVIETTTKKDSDPVLKGLSVSAKMYWLDGWSCGKKNFVSFPPNLINFWLFKHAHSLCILVKLQAKFLTIFFSQGILKEVMIFEFLVGWLV